jgi:BCD family chlorophyll transporter-like MFS transporter
VLGFVLIGAGVGCAGTALLALLSSRVAPERRPAAATIVWLMMIFGIAVTAGVVGGLLDPYSGERLIVITACVAGVALTLATLGVLGVEGPSRPSRRPSPRSRSARPSRRPGPSPARGCSRSSSSSRCWPITRRS